MSRLLPIDHRAKNQIRLLHAQGQVPSEIVISMKRKGIALSAKQVSNLIQREQWSRQKAAIEEAKEKGAREVLEKAREEGARSLETVLKLQGESLLVDSTNLRDGWDLVEDAAGASSLQRAKLLLAQRTTRHFGLDVPAEGGQQVLLAAVFGRPIGDARATSSAGAACVDVACAEAYEGKASDDSDGDRLEFE